jgi:hypothetical protein
MLRLSPGAFCYLATLRNRLTADAVSSINSGMANPTLSRKSADSLNTPRIRFNWGYHDGAFAKERGLLGNGHVADMSAHKDRIYAAGVSAGRADVEHGEYRENSDSAWSAYRAA